MYEIGNFTVFGEHEDDPGGLSIKILPYSHSSAYGWWNKSTKAVLNTMFDLPIQGATVLDLGCGASAILSVAAKKMGAAKVVACEHNPELLEIAKLQIKANNLDIEVVAETKEEFDIILANVGDTELVEQLKTQSKQGIGTSKEEEELILW